MRGAAAGVQTEMTSFMRGNERGRSSEDSSIEITSGLRALFCAAFKASMGACKEKDVGPPKSRNQPKLTKGQRLLTETKPRARSRAETMPMGAPPTPSSTSKWCKLCLVIVAAASRSLVPSGTWRGASGMRPRSNQSRSFSSLLTPSAKACNAHRGVIIPCKPPSSMTSAAFWPKMSSVLSASPMVSLDRHVGTDDTGFMTMSTRVWSAPALATSNSEVNPQSARAMSRAEKTPNQPPVTAFTTKWWHVWLGSAALSIKDAASIKRTDGGTWKCCNISACCNSVVLSKSSMCARLAQPSR
mmetsp:Transcript_40259/g.113944  ORF Transcript_40259/g.113944 Transcript_40259/m.113944 type:complete len:300 (+) Transcript_40259:293-1192(+)